MTTRCAGSSPRRASSSTRARSAALTRSDAIGSKPSCAKNGIFHGTSRNVVSVTASKPFEVAHAHTVCTRRRPSPRRA